MSLVDYATAARRRTSNWRTRRVQPGLLLAWAVNVGGFGLLPGSLANLIALRMAGDRRIWWRFHIYSLPMLLWAALVGYGLLQL